MSSLKIGTSYFGCRATEYVKNDMKYLKENNFTSVLHTFSEEDFMFYGQSVKEIIKVSHDEGLEVYLGPWGLAGVFGGEAFSRFLVQNPNDWQVISDGNKYPTVCINSSSLLDFMYSWIDFAADAGADVVFWDEPHWFLPFLFVHPEKYHIWGCRCNNCKELYKKMFKTDMPLTETEDVLRFKHIKLNEFLFKISDYAKAKGLKVAVCLLPTLESEEDKKHWEEVISYKSIDIISTDPYWELGPNGLDSHYNLPLDEYVGYFSSQLSDICKKHEKEPQIWIQNFRLVQDHKKVKEAIEVAFNAGVNNIFAWGFKGSQYMSFLRCKDSNEAWQYFLEGTNSINSSFLNEK